MMEKFSATAIGINLDFWEVVSGSAKENKKLLLKTRESLLYWDIRLRKTLDFGGMESRKCD